MNPTCIIVDDHESLRNLLVDWLQTVFSNVDFVGAATGEEAVDFAYRYNPVVVIMDVGLPGISGIEATRQIKQTHPQTFVILHTIHDELAYRQDAASAGADIYISKSKTQTDLIPVLLKVFSAAEVNGSEQIKEIQSGGYETDL